MRADAQRRRTAIIDSAIELFRTHGPDIALDKVAAHAGVGIATLYRNFPDRTSLTTACTERLGLHFLEHQSDIVARFEGASTQQARQLVHDYAHELLSLGATSLIPAFVPQELDKLDPSLEPELRQLIAGGEEFIRLGRAAGAIGPKVTHLEFVVGLLALARPRTVNIEEYQGDLEDRMVELYLAGIRVGHPQP